VADDLGSAIAKLRADLGGRVIVPGDDTYEKARQVFSGAIDRHPAAVVRVTSEDEVARVVTHARDTGVELAVRSGGHSAYAVNDGGVVLDLSGLRQLDIDADARVARVQTGLTAGDYTTAAGRHGLATGFGDTGSVGIGGITLGGGVGFLARKYGLTIDDLLAAEVVTADGELIRVDADNHPDLFWAIRGGGGNFGVVTRFTFRLHEVPEVTGGMLVLPATPDTVTGFLEAAAAAPDELSTIANVMSAPPMPFLPESVHGKVILMALVCHAGPAAAGERVMAPFRALAEPYADHVTAMPYPEIYGPEEPGYRPKAIGSNLFRDSVDKATVETILAHLADSDAPMRVAQLRVLGGAVARVPVDATAFAHRDRAIMVNLASFYTGDEDLPRRQEWLRTFSTAMRDGAPAGYVNFIGEDDGGVGTAYPAPTLARLAQVKRRYDPDNVFRFNVNVRPA